MDKHGANDGLDAYPLLSVAFWADDEVEAQRQLVEWAEQEQRLVSWQSVDRSRDDRRFTFKLRVLWDDDQGRLAV